MGSFVAVRRPLSSCGVWAPECAGSVVAVYRLSSCGTWAPEHMGSREHGLCSCGTWALQLWHVGLAALQHVESWFPNQGSNQGLLHCKKHSEPPDHQGSPPLHCLKLTFYIGER